MKGLLQNLLHGQEGVAMLVVLSFMALSVPLVAGMLTFGGTVSKDSQTKTRILKGQYASQGCTQHAAYRLKTDSAYANSISIGGSDTYVFDGCTITITKVSGPQASKVAFADIVITLDVSGSVDDTELAELKQAANQIVDAFDLENSNGRMRIGVLRFRGSSESVVDMTDVDVHGVSQPLHNGINGLVQGGPGLASGTNIVAGLNGSKLQFDTGLGDRTNPPYPVPNLILFITDGDDTAGNSDPAIRGVSMATGAEVFAVGVGTDIDIGTINAIASDPDPVHAFTTASFAGLLTIINDLVTALLNASGMGTLFLIQAVSPDGTVSVMEVVLPP